MKDSLHDMKYFLLGDSVYTSSIDSFILTPFDRPGPYSTEDDFDF